MAALSGKIFCITGTLSVLRQEFVDFLQVNGGQVEKSVTKKVTHLISTRTDTAKAKQALEKGIQVLSEDDVRAMVGTSGNSQDAVISKQDEFQDQANAPQEEEDPPAIMEPQRTADENSEKKSNVLSGMVFCIVGDLSVPKKEFSAFLERNGGQVETYMQILRPNPQTKNVITHLVSNDPNNAKAKKAAEKGIEIVSEETVREMLNGNMKDDNAKKPRISSPKKKAPETTTSSSSSDSAKDAAKPLSGMIFCITGAVSILRRHFVAFLEANGGQVENSVNSKVTHLISTRSDTAKAQKAMARGVDVLSEENVRALVPEDSPEKHVSIKQEEEEDPIKEEEGPTGGGPLADMVFCITGAVSVLRKDFVAYLKANGGRVENSVNKQVTHLISTRSDTIKAQKAIDNGIQVLSEEQVRILVDDSNHNSKQEPHDTKEVESPNKKKNADAVQAVNGGSSLSGMFFCITGAVSVVRKEFVEFLEANGGQVENSVTSRVTHLISTRSDTAKAKQAIQKGIEVLSEDEVRTMVALFGDDSDNENANTTENDNSELPKKRTRRANATTSETTSETTTASTAALNGMVFCITGAVSVLRREFVDFLEAHGGRVENSVNKRVTHLISTRSDTVKAQKAIENGVKVLSENDVRQLVGEETVDEPPRKKPKNEMMVPVLDEIADGEVREVQGSGSKPYIIKNIGGVYSCNCPAWRFQSKNPDVRICKHLKAIRGAAAEAERVGGDIGAAASTTSRSKSSPKGGSTAPLADGTLFQARNLMLAHKWDPQQHTPGEYLMSEKLDGMRALWDGKQLVSRAGNLIEAPDFFLKGLPSDLALDGELFAGRGKFQHTVSIARRKNGGELWRELKYVVFDAPSAKGGFEARLSLAEAAVSGHEFAEIHPHSACRDNEHLESELERVERIDGEGLMMRKKNSLYVHGQTNELLKVKTFLDDEAIVVGTQQGKGRHAGRMGALECKLRNGKEFKVGSGFSDAQREKPPAIGSIITVRYFELTKAGVPRFPTFQRVRKDVDSSEFE